MIIIKYFENGRVLHLYDAANPSTISSISKDLISVLESDEKQSWTICNYERPPIKLVINSYGGSVDDMFGLIDVILTSKTPIYTYCTGYAMSAGAMIFLAGHKRYCYQHTTFMLHSISTFECGKYQQFMDGAARTKELQRQLNDYILERTSISKDVLLTAQRESRDIFYPAQEAKKYGIVNKIIT